MDRIEQQQKESPKKKITQSHHIEQQRVAGKKQKMDGSVLDRVIFFYIFFFENGWTLTAIQLQLLAAFCAVNI